MSQTTEHIQLSTVGQQRFERLQALQAHGAEGMRLLARTAWAALDARHQLRLIGQAVTTFGSEDKAKQDAFINAVLISEYISDTADPEHLFHHEVVRPSPNAFGDVVSG